MSREKQFASYSTLSRRSILIPRRTDTAEDENTHETRVRCKKPSSRCRQLRSRGRFFRRRECRWKTATQEVVAEIIRSWGAERADHPVFNETLADRPPAGHVVKHFSSAYTRFQKCCPGIGPAIQPPAGAPIENARNAREIAN